MVTRRKAPTWQRISSGLLSTATVALLAASSYNGVPKSLHQAAIQLLAAYGALLFGHIAVTGRLPGRTQGRLNRP
jgi:hypothetical protein